MCDSWKNKVAIVTGASAGIGARIAVRLANAGMIVVGLARRVELIEALNNEVTGSGKICPRRCDLADEQCISETFQWIREHFDVIHVLVNNAGILRATLLTETSTKEIKSIFDVNVVASCVCIREAIKNMQISGTNGHIVVINSILGHRIPDVPVPLFSVYPSTKHAITALCQTTRQEISFLKLNIKLTSISPGMVDTDLLDVYSGSPMLAELPKLKPDDVAQAVLYALDTPDHVQVEDILLQAMRRQPTF